MKTVQTIYNELGKLAHFCSEQQHMYESISGRDEAQRAYYQGRAVTYEFMLDQLDSIRTIIRDQEEVI